MPVYREPVTILHMGAGAPDKYGDDTDAEVSRTDTVARIWQTDSREISFGRDTVVSDWRLGELDPSIALDAGDRVIAGGRTFEVVGAPALVRTTRGRERHVEANLRYVQG